MKSTLGAFFPIFGNGDTIAAVAVSSIARFPVLNPCASLAGVARYVCGEPRTVPRIGGHKYFYLSWKLDIWRCEAWNEPLGSVFDLDRIPDQREPCNACMMACYRKASMLMHAAVAASDAARAAAGRIGLAAAALFRRSVAQSLWALVEMASEMGILRPTTSSWHDDAAAPSTPSVQISAD